ncbi:MAG: HvfC family RiPP maturation protein [Methylococcaceae bacterium]
MPNSQPETNKVDFSSKQSEFGAYIRDPVNNPVPADVRKQRMEMYRELFFNNINSFLSSNFPVLRTILDDQQWLDLVQDFFVKHRCKSPHFSEIPEEFLDYLQNERDSSGDFPFMLELAHYEWVEMALSIAKENCIANTQLPDNLLAESIQLSPLAWTLAYQYPVHKIAPAFLPATAPEQPTFLIVYRDCDDDVHFIEITPMTYRLLEIIQEQGNVLTETCLKQVAQEANFANPDMIIAGGLQIIKDLVDKSIITLAE